MKPRLIILLLPEEDPGTAKAAAEQSLREVHLNPSHFQTHYVYQFRDLPKNHLGKSWTYQTEKHAAAALAGEPTAWALATYRNLWATIPDQNDLPIADPWYPTEFQVKHIRAGERAFTTRSEQEPTTLVQVPTGTKLMKPGTYILLEERVLDNGDHEALYIYRKEAGETEE